MHAYTFLFFYSNGATVYSGVVSRPGTLRMSKIEHGHSRCSPRWFFSPRREANRIKYSQSAEDNWKCWWLTQTFCRLGMLEFCTCFVGLEWMKHPEELIRFFWWAPVVSCTFLASLLGQCCAAKLCISCTVLVRWQESVLRHEIVAAPCNLPYCVLQHRQNRQSQMGWLKPALPRL